nr:putative ferric-chelate reductase 1 [Crassostrea gigas]XP_034309392.1 putative ferric-chelate reductase 1 [Crassostrea gigas]XP_034309393.1 putative ferric-chelate reductase 1 [Crassostrea gigas]
MQNLVLLAALVFIPGVTPYPYGPPLGACMSMFPKGHGVDAQKSPPPFEILVNSTSYREADVIQITINTTGLQGVSYYEGMMIQARRSACDLDKPTKSHGKFSLQANEWFLDTMDCENNPQSAVVHKNHSHVESNVFYWTAPAPTGHIYFIGTIVKNKTLFWTNVLSPLIKDVNSNEEVKACSGVTSIHGCPLTSIIILLFSAILFLR